MWYVPPDTTPSSGGGPSAMLMATHSSGPALLASHPIPHPALTRQSRQSLCAVYDDVAQYAVSCGREVRWDDVGLFLLAACDRAAVAASEAGPPEDPMRHPPFWPFAVDVGSATLQRLLRLVTAAWGRVRTGLSGAAPDAPDAGPPSAVLCLVLRLLQTTARVLIHSPADALALAPRDPASPVAGLRAVLEAVVDDPALAALAQTPPVRGTGATAGPAPVTPPDRASEAREIRDTACDVFCATVLLMSHGAGLEEVLPPLLSPPTAPAEAAPPRSAALRRRVLLRKCTDPGLMRRVVRDVLRPQYKSEGASPLLQGFVDAAFCEAEAPAPALPGAGDAADVFGAGLQAEVLFCLQRCLAGLMAEDAGYQPLFICYGEALLRALDALSPAAGQALLAAPKASLLRLLTPFVLALNTIAAPNAAARLVQYAYRVRLWLRALEPDAPAPEPRAARVTLGPRTYALRCPAPVPPGGWAHRLHVPGAWRLQVTLGPESGWKSHRGHMAAFASAAPTPGRIEALALLEAGGAGRVHTFAGADTLELWLQPARPEGAGPCTLRVWADGRAVEVVTTERPQWVLRQVDIALHSCLAILRRMLSAAAAPGPAAAEASGLQRYLETCPLLQAGLVEALQPLPSGPARDPPPQPFMEAAARVWQRMQTLCAQQPQQPTPRLPPVVGEALQLLFAALLRQHNVTGDLDLDLTRIENQVPPPPPPPRRRSGARGRCGQ